MANVISELAAQGINARIDKDGEWRVTPGWGGYVGAVYRERLDSLKRLADETAEEIDLIAAGGDPVWNGWTRGERLDYLRDLYAIVGRHDLVAVWPNRLDVLAQLSGLLDGVAK